jgi:cyclic beta-1,2-glucan synthetase
MSTASTPHIGRGGWTWYTGSAGWMYRLIVESLLGLRLEGETLRIEPCLPADWDGFKLQYRYRSTIYRISVTQGQDGDGQRGIARLRVDGVDVDAQWIQLVDDQREHAVDVRIGG